MSTRRRSRGKAAPAPVVGAARAAEPGLLATLRADLAGALTPGARGSVRARARRTLADLEEFYLSSQQQERLAGARGLRRWVLRSWWLFTGLVMRLTPARRLLLAAALVGMSALRFHGEKPGTGYSFDFQGLSVLLLLLVLALELKDKLVAHDELEAGRSVQHALMPAEAPHVQGWDIWMYTRSANEVGGDLVDYVPMEDGETALVLADVSGKGLSAALLTAKLQATLRALAAECDSLGRFGERVNHIMYRDGVRSRFATLVWLSLRPGAGGLRVLNAGHMPPLIVSDRGVDAMPRGSVALALVPSASFTEQAATLEPGDTLVVYSDGVTETMNADRDFFGDRRLREVLLARRGCEAAVMGRAILDATDAFAGTTPAHDDLSLLIARRLTARGA